MPNEEKLVEIEVALGCVHERLKMLEELAVRQAKALEMLAEALNATNRRLSQLRGPQPPLTGAN